jgi:hypothetical protein
MVASQHNRMKSTVLLLSKSEKYLSNINIPQLKEKWKAI